MTEIYEEMIWKWQKTMICGGFGQFAVANSLRETVQVAITVFTSTLIGSNG